MGVASSNAVIGAWCCHYSQKQERPPGEEEGAFPYSDSAKRECQSVSYVGRAGARPVWWRRALPGVVPRPRTGFGLSSTPRRLGAGDHFSEGKAGSASGPGGVVVLDFQPSGTDLHPYGQTVDLHLAHGPGRRPPTQVLAPHAEGTGLGDEDPADLLGQDGVGEGAD